PTLRRLDETGGITLQDTVGAGYVIRTGQPILAESVDEEALRQAARSPAQLEALLALEPTSAMIVPMKARGRTIGAISFVTTTDSDRRYRQDDLKLGLALATRAALFADNARLYAKARSAIKARDDMLAVVSHDLRNPLQSISTAATLLKVAPAGEHTARTIESVSVAAAQMERLLNDLLDISRMEAGKFLVQPQPADLRSLLDEAIMLF